MREAIRGPRRVGRVWATDKAARADWLRDREVERADEREIARLAGSDGHQGVCAEVAPFDYVAGADLLTTPDPLIVALDQIQDPQNLGAICRSAEVLGATGVAIPERRSALVTPAVCKASAGAVEHLPIALVRNLADFLIQARDAGSWIYGAAAEGGVAHDQVDFSGGAVLVLGSEGRGLRPRVAGVCDQLVTIIQAGTIDSLNVSAAAAILLDAAARSRRAGDAGR